VGLEDPNSGVVEFRDIRMGNMGGARRQEVGAPTLGHGPARRPLQEKPAAPGIPPWQQTGRGLCPKYVRHVSDKEGGTVISERKPEMPLIMRRLRKQSRNTKNNAAVMKVKRNGLVC